MPGEDYVSELRQALAEARRVARQAELEKEVFQRQAAEFKAKVKEFQGPPAPPTVRTLSRKDYARAKSDAMRDMMRAEHARKEAATLPKLDGINVKDMTPEQYREFKRRLTRRGW